MNPVNKRKSAAPKPPKDANGDSSGKVNARGLKAKYDKAHAKGDIQSAYNLKKEARAKGADVSSW